MRRLSIVASVLVLLFWPGSSRAQQTKQWSVGGAFGSSTQLSLSYNPSLQWRLSFILGPFGNLYRTTSDRVGFSAIYYFDTSNSPLFLGFAPGITTREQHAFIAVIPAGVLYRINNDFSVSFAGELFVTKNELHRTAGGMGISIGGFVYL